MLRRVALVRTDVSEELSASFIRVTRRQIPPKRRLIQESHGVTSQKTPFFIVTAVKTLNLAYHYTIHSRSPIGWYYRLAYTASIVQ
jgi:hypothetical protein